MSGYMSQATTYGPVQIKQALLNVKGDAFDMQGYLNKIRNSRSLTQELNKVALSHKQNVHAHPNLLFIPAS